MHDRVEARKIGRTNVSDIEVERGQMLGRRPEVAAAVEERVESSHIVARRRDEGREH